MKNTFITLALVLSGSVPLGAQNWVPESMDQTLDRVSTFSGKMPLNYGRSGVSDDFNRPDGPIGGNWVDQVGTQEILNNTGIGTNFQGNAWALYSGANCDYTETHSFDLLPRISPDLSYVAAISGIGADNLFTKIQNQGGTLFNFAGFYHAFNGGGLGGYGGFMAIVPVTGGRIDMYVTNAGDTMNIDIDENFDGIVDYNYQSSGILAAFGATLGTGVGLGTYNDGHYDNWEVGDPISWVPGSVCASITPGANNRYNGCMLDLEFDTTAEIYGIDLLLENASGSGAQCVVDVHLLEGASYSSNSSNSMGWTSIGSYQGGVSDGKVTVSMSEPLTQVPSGRHGLFVNVSSTDWKLKTTDRTQSSSSTGVTLYPGIGKDGVGFGGTNAAGQLGVDKVYYRRRLLIGPFILRIENLVAGSTATISTTAGTPGGLVGVAYSLVGPGPSVVGAGPCGPIMVDLSDPIATLGTFTSDGSGNMSTTASVPAGTTGVSIWMQALDVPTCRLSNLVAEVIG